MKHKYAIIGGVLGLFVPSVLVVLFTRMWGVEITDRTAVTVLTGVGGVLFAAIGASLGAEVDMEEDND